MKFPRLHPWMGRTALAAAAAALIATLMPSSGSAEPAAYRPLAYSAQVSFLQQPAGPALATSTGGGSGRSHLPSSVMPNNIVGLRCSVDASDAGTPPTCSTGSSSILCSAHCDNLQFCSAFPFATGAASACSTLGGIQTRCSVLQPNLTLAGPSMCSIFEGTPGQTQRCSVLGPGGKEACSAQNGATFTGNQCSTNPLTGTGGGLMQCSVLGGGTTLRNRCSTGDPVLAGQVAKQCSVFVTASACSVKPPNKSFCSAFVPAPAGTCSSFAAGATCSVIGGTSGAFCKWP